MESQNENEKLKYYSYYSQFFGRHKDKLSQSLIFQFQKHLGGLNASKNPEAVNRNIAKLQSLEQHIKNESDKTEPGSIRTGKTQNYESQKKQFILDLVKKDAQSKSHLFDNINGLNQKLSNDQKYEMAIERIKELQTPQSRRENPTLIPKMNNLVKFIVEEYKNSHIQIEIPEELENSLFGETGVDNQQPAEEKKQPPIVQQKYQIQSPVSDYMKKLQQQSKNSSNQEIKKRATVVLKKIKNFMKDSELAKKSLQEVRGPEHQNGNSSNDLALTNKQEVPFGSHNISLEDAADSKTAQLLVDSLVSQHNLTQQQSLLLEQVCLDPKSIQQNYTFIKKLQPNISSSQSSSQNQDWSDALVNEWQNDGELSHLEIDNISDISLAKDSEGNSISINDYFDYIQNTASFVSEIAGEIKNVTDLKKYKTRTKIFGTKVIKQEPTTFEIAPGTAYKLRQCC